MSAPFALRDADAEFESNAIRPGSYGIAQTDPGEWWDLTSADCDDGSPVNSVQLDPGETVTWKGRRFRPILFSRSLTNEHLLLE